MISARTTVTFTKLFRTILLCVRFTAMGYGLVYAPSVGIVGHYFDRHKYFASTLVTVGSALGVFVFPPLFTLTAEFYGWRGSMLINCGIAANICVCGMVYAADPHRTPQSTTTSPSKNVPDVELQSSTNAITATHTVVAAQNSSSPVVRADTFHLYLLRDPLFISMLFYVFFASSYTNFLYFIPLMYEKHFDAEQHKQSAALLVSLFGVGNVAARIVNAVANINESIANKYWKRFRVAEASALVLAFAHIYIFYAGSALEMQLFSVLIGAGWGFVLSSWPGMLTELFGRRVLSITWGRTLLFCGLYRFILVPISGWLIDATASFAAAFYIAGVCQLCAFGLLLYVDVKQTRRMKRVSYKTADEMVPANVPRNLNDEATASALSPGLDRHHHESVDGGNVERRIVAGNASPITQQQAANGGSSKASPSNGSKKRVFVTTTTTTTLPSSPTQHVPSPPPYNTGEFDRTAAADEDDDDPTLRPTIGDDDDADVNRPMSPVDDAHDAGSRHERDGERIAPT